ncbi:MAG: DUF4373 domain-containing protein [Lachnospiraceae bacterium]|nr:DUF4373 domain-containing protein [Lachnospiraceae bacterium]
MGRQNEVSLHYFELDCHMDEKVKLIRAEFGLKGFALVVMMYQHIYGGDHGYYCEWDEERLLLFMSDNGLIGESKNLIDEVVHACIRRDIFSDRLFKEYGILTSSGVQKQYLKATAKRQVVNLKKEYLLISIPEIRTNVVVNSISGGINSISGGINSQSKSRVENSNSKKDMCKAGALALFERLWKLYPVKRGKGKVSDTQKMNLLEIGFDEMSRAIERYRRYVESVDYLPYQNGSTFFNSGYVDYLDMNYTKTTSKNQKNSFNNFHQREYDFEQLEKDLTGR